VAAAGLVIRFRSGWRLMRMDAAVRQDFTWVLAGNAVYSACQWLILVFLAKLGRPEQVGEYALGVAITAPILMFANLQLRALVAADISESCSFGQYVAFRLATLAASLLVVAAVLVSARYSWQLAFTTTLIGVGQALDYVSETYYGQLQKFDHMDRVSRALMIKGPLSLLALGAGMYATGSLLAAVAAQTAARALVLVVYESRLAFGGMPAFRLEWNTSRMGRLLRHSLPLGVISTLVILNLNIPRYFLEASWTRRELGVFSAMASLVGAGNLVMAALGQAVYVRLVRAWLDADRRAFIALFLHLLLVAAALGASATAVGAIWGKQVLTRLFRPEYATHVDAFAVLMVAAGLAFAAYAQGVALTAIGSFHPQIAMLLCSSATAVIACYRLVPARGVRGAAEALALTSLVQVAAGMVVLARNLRRPATAEGAAA
jgi:O-antigen/teichoic acid export membrane protein